MNDKLVYDKNDDDEQLATELCQAPISDELKIFNRISDLNWAWNYEISPGCWLQFECLNCMLLESKW